MPKPNYDFEKRQRENAKKAKKDAKLNRKQAPTDDAAPEPADGGQEAVAEQPEPPATRPA